MFRIRFCPITAKPISAISAVGCIYLLCPNRGNHDTPATLSRQIFLAGHRRSADRLSARSPKPVLRLMQPEKYRPSLTVDFPGTGCVLHSDPGAQHAVGSVQEETRIAPENHKIGAQPRDSDPDGTRRRQPLDFQFPGNVAGGGGGLMDLSGD